MKTSPRRIQRRRTRGWRMPDGARYVGRPTVYGNPFVVGHTLVRYGPRHEAEFGRAWDYEGRVSRDGTRHDMWFSPTRILETYVRYATQAECAELYRMTLTAPTPGMRGAFPSRGAGSPA